MAAIFRDSAAAVVRTRPRAIPLSMITMRKSIHGFPFLSYMGMGLRLAVLDFHVEHVDFGLLNYNKLTRCFCFQDWLAFVRGGVQLTFQGKLQFENGGAPLEQDNFAFCKVKLFYFFNTGKLKDEVVQHGN